MPNTTLQPWHGMAQCSLLPKVFLKSVYNACNCMFSYSIKIGNKIITYLNVTVNCSSRVYISKAF